MHNLERHTKLQSMRPHSVQRQKTSQVEAVDESLSCCRYTEQGLAKDTSLHGLANGGVPDAA